MPNSMSGCNATFVSSAISRAGDTRTGTSLTLMRVRRAFMMRRCGMSFLRITFGCSWCSRYWASFPARGRCCLNSGRERVQTLSCRQCRGARAVDGLAVGLAKCRDFGSYQLATVKIRAKRKEIKRNPFIISTLLCRRTVARHGGA